MLGIAAMRLARGLLLPVAIAILLTLLLSAPVRWLRAHRVPERFGAALVVAGTLAAVAGAGALLVGPAVDWVNAVPATLQNVERKLRLIERPLAELKQSAERVERVTAPQTAPTVSKVEVAQPGIFARVSAQALDALPATVGVVFLTYFLLASGPLFRRKLSEFFPGRRDHARGAREH